MDLEDPIVPDTSPTKAKENEIIKINHKVLSENKSDTAATMPTEIINNNENNKNLVEKGTERLLYPEQLQAVLSNLYLDAVKRLHLIDPLRCARDFAYCHQNHYRALLPDAPTFSLAKGLRAALLQKQYSTFFQIAEHMCVREVFPGDGVLLKLIEMLLVLCLKDMNVYDLKLVYVGAIQLFRLIVGTFPPCWRTLRPYYVNLVTTSLRYTKPKNERIKPSVESKPILPLLFELLETTLEECSAADVQDYNFIEKTKKSGDDENVTMDEDDLNSVTMSEYMNDYDWVDDQLCLESFYAMPPQVRLSRLFDTLELLLHVLEADFVMWLLHHYKNTAKWFFCGESNALLVAVFELKEYTRQTSVVRQLLKLFAIAASKGLHVERFEILERYLSLLMEASNTAEIETTVIGCKYPVVGKQTHQLIHDLFKTFKTHNPSGISNYITAITLMRQPYLRYEFINYFLSLFYFPPNEPFTPKKITIELLKKRWVKYPTNVENTDDLSRAQYLQLLLMGLQAYCEWHGTSTFFYHITHNKRVEPLQTVGDSRYHFIAGTGNRFMLQKIEENIDEMNKNLKIKFKLKRPKIDLPLMDILIDDATINKYRTDMKFLVILYEQLPKQAADSTIDLNDWLKYLQQFSEQMQTSPT